MEATYQSSPLRRATVTYWSGLASRQRVSSQAAGSTPSRGAAGLVVRFWRESLMVCMPLSYRVARATWWLQVVRCRSTPSLRANSTGV